MIGPNGYAERRPGFSSTLETVPTIFHNLQRIYSWNRFDGTFVQMACDLNASNQTVVYKRVVGMDNSFSSIYTDTSSSTPFDFVVSNNTVYFSNGTTAKKFDPANGVTNWGIAAGSNSANTVGPRIAGNGINNGNNAQIWANPNNVTSTTVYAEASINGPDDSDNIDITQFGFGIPATETISGVQIDLEVFIDTNVGTDGNLHVGMIRSGVFTGTPKDVTITNTTVQTLTLGGPSDLWGVTWTPNDINQTNFGCFMQFNLGAAITNDLHVRNVRITIYGTGGPSVSVSGSAGSMSATIGYQYIVCYGNSNSGHISSPGPPSASTGVFTNKLNVGITVKASSDSQVNQIRLFRSTDSVASGTNAGLYFELPTSPYPNANATVLDTAVDLALNVNSVAPISGANDPPTPGQCPVYFSGRIWMFKNNQVFFSGLEETINGVPEESFPSGVAGNFWNFDEPVTALAVAGTLNNQALMIFTPGKIYAIVGNSLDTFRRFLVSNRNGCRSIKNVTSLGGTVIWLSTSGQLWMTDGQSMNEIGIDIRRDLANIDQELSCVTTHVGQEVQWALVSTGEQVFVADMNLQAWMPPWSFACQYLGSYELDLGSYGLVAATSTTALQLNQSGTVGSYNDHGATYQPIARMGLKPLIPDYSTYSATYSEISTEPTKAAYLTGVCITTNKNSLADVFVAVDDDPTNASTKYTSIAANSQTPQVAFKRGQGVNLVQNIYTTNKEAEGAYVSVQVIGQKADDNLRLYSYFIGSDPIG